MALIDIVNQVQETIVALNSACTFGFGEEAISARTAPPYVVWVPTTDEYEVGGEQHTGTNKGAPRVIAMRMAGMDAHIWGSATPPAVEDWSTTEALIAIVVNGLRANLKARDLLNLRGRWEDTDGDGTEAAAFGRAYVLSFQIRIPIVETGVVAGTPVTLGNTPSVIPTTSQAVFPDGNTYTNP